MLVDWGFELALGSLINPVDASVEVAPLTSKISQSEESIDIVRLLIFNFLVESVALIVFVHLLIPIGHIELYGDL